MENATLRNFLLRITLSISAAALLSISTTAQRVTSELVSLYTFEEGSGSVVNDVSGVSPAEDLHISHPNAIDWIPGGGLRIQSSTIVASDGPGTKHYNLLHNSPEISLEMWVGQTDTHQNGPARMMTLSQDTGERNFTLGHENSDYVVRMRTTNTNDQGTPESDMDVNIQSGLQHVVYTYNVNTGVEKWYLNGQLQDTDSRGGSLNNWDPSHVFALANEITMDRPWLGDIHLAAVYCQVLDADEVMQNFEAGVNGQELCATILNGSSPYPANDPFFQQVIEEDSYCCESWWDHICDDLYVDHATTGDLTETCSLDGFGYPGGRIFWLPNEFGTDFKASDSGLFFDKFDDGTARIYGQVERISDAHEKFQVSIWFNNFSDYDTWIAQGGEAKGTHLGDETTWVFYSQDLSKTSYLKGLQDLDGELLYILPQDDNDYGLQLGDGANDLNSNDNGMSMWFDYVGTTNGHGDLNATYQCDDAPEPPVETFTLDCEDALKVSIEGIGMEGDGCADLDINYEEGNLEYIILETVWKANNPPASVVFTADGTEYTATAQIVVEGNGTDQGNKRAYRVQVPAASNVGVCVPNGFNHKLLSLVAYTFRSEMDLISTGSGEFVGRHLFNDSYTMSLSVPAADAPRDIVVTMPISDMSNDGRFADFIVTAGDITRSFAVTGNTNGLSLNLVPFVLENVPGDVTEVSIDLISDPNREPNPSSFLAAGLAVADAQCNVPEEEKICEIVGFNGPGTRHFVFFNAFGTNYTSSEEGLSWIEYADGTAKITGQIFAISDPDKIFDVTLYFEGKSNYDEFIAQGGEAKLEDGATLADAQDWTFYTFDDDRPNVLTGRGENEGVYIFLRQMDGMPYGLQVGANGANGKNDEFGISTWFSYSGTHEGNGDLNANLLCPEPICEVECPADLELDCESATHPDFTGYPTLICADNAGCVREPGEFDFEFQGWGGSTDGWSFGPGWDVGTGCDPACGDIPNVFIDFTNFHTDYNTKLKSPMYDACCTDEVSLSFCMQQDLYGGEDVPGFLKVQYRVHGGNWQTLETFESEYGATINYDREYVLDGAAGNTFEVRFKAYGEGSNYFTMGGWGIDNVRVFGQTEGCSAGEEEVSVDWSFSDVSNGTCPEVITRTFTATYQGENVECIQTLTLIDDSAPIFNSVPDDVTYACADEVVASSASALDNCSEDVEVTSEDIVNGSGCVFTIDRVFTATDACGNTATYTQVITINDDQAPVFTYVPEDVSGNCGDVFGEELATAVDNCTGVVVTYNDVYTEFTETVCGQFRTQTPGGWGAPANGNNPGVYRDANFDGAFPNGLTIGCNNTLTLTSAQAVEDFLPSGGTPSALPAGSLVDPSGYGNTFAGHLVAAKLALGFDAFDVDFSDATASFGDLIVNNGPFSGMTVSEVIDAADQVIGGCSNAYSPSALTSVLTMINENYVDGNTDNGNLDCNNDELCGFFITRTFTAEDDCGNTSITTQCFMVTDEEAPVLIGVPEDATVECDDVPPAAEVTAEDDCATDLEVVFTEDVHEIDECVTEIVRTWVVVDDCGKEALASQTLTVTDTAAPVIVEAPEDVTINCDEAEPSDAPVFTDNCDENLDVTMTSSITEQDCGFIIEKSWTATDDCGNSVTATQTITVVDTEGPVITFQTPDQTIECDEEIPAINVTFVDNCDEDLTVVVDNYTNPLDCGFEYVKWCSATDDCGNTTEALVTITVLDTEAPVALSTPQDVTIECDQPEPSDMPVFSDNCDPNFEVVAASSISQLDCGFVIEKSWTATDECGNSTTVNQNITVTDTTAPELTGVPADETVECTDIPAAAMVTATDNCDDNVEVFFTETVEMLDCGYLLIRTWSATDNCGNSVSDEQVITVTDTVAPEFAAEAADATVECDNIPAAPELTATDACDDNVDVAFAEEMNPVDECIYEIIRTWTATDDCGNVAVETQVLTVQDTTPPTADGEGVVMDIDCDEDVPESTLTFSDNCDNNLEVTVHTQLQPLDCTFQYIQVVSATDDCGNTTSVTNIYTVVDDEAPVLIGVPEDATIDCDDEVPNAIVAAQDNCDEDVEVSLTAETVYNDCGYEIVRTWTAVDACGNEASATQVLTVTDTEAPVFEECPAPYVVNCDNGSSDPEFAGEPVVSDNCSEFEVTFEDGVATDECPATFTRTWIATDACGNASTCEQEITINDFEAPVIDCPADVTIECTESTDPANTGVATATDDCSEPNISFEDSAMMGDCPYTIERTWTALDPCGNTSTCVQVITIVDTEAPMLSGEDAEVTIECDMSADLPEVTATDNCDDDVEIDLTTEVIDGDCPQEFTEVYTWIATDDCDNQSVRTFTVNYVDTTAPILIGVPADDTIDCDDEVPNAIVAAQDNCDPNVEVSLTAETVYNECGYEIVRTWSATDACGNTVSQTQTLTVEDTTPPVFEECPAPYVVNCDNGSSDPEFAGEPVVSDNCSEFEVTFEDGVATDECPATFTRTWIATDACGNASTCEQEITINDFEAPVIDCPADVTIECTESTDPANTGVATATDDCSEPNISFEDSAMMGDCPYTIERTWTALDPCGNTSTCVQVITIVDTEAPMLSGEDAEVTIECDMSADLPEVTATDNCDEDVEIDLVTEVIDGDCPQEFTEVYTWTATDDCGNQSVRTFTVNYVDTTAPILIGVPEDDTIDCDDDVPNAIVAAQDNCDPNVEVSLTAETVYNECGYEIVRTWSATDACGNTVSQTQTLTVEDTTPPVFEECPAPYVVNCDNGSSDPAFAGEPVVSDNCSEFEVTFEDGVATDECPATFTRTWIATDACGNASTCEQEITINDFEAPVIDCPADVTIECTESTDPANTGVATATDDCSEPNISFEDSAMMGDCPYTIERTWTALDPCGNTSTCVQVITIVDTEAPVLSGEDGEETIECDMAIDLPEVTATDNCDEDVEIDLVTEVIDGDCPQEFTEVYTWIATDDCDNQSVRTFTVNYVDTTAPILIGVPADDTIDCDDDVPNAIVAAQDNCDPNVEVSLTAETVYNECGYEIVRTWSATDACGNTVSQTQTLTVEDTTPPVFEECPAPYVVDCDNGYSDPAFAGEPVVSDNCSEFEVTFEDGVATDECPATFTRTWIATDACGNASTCEQEITINDFSEPIIDCPADITVECPESTGPENTGMATATDDCSVPVITYVDGPLMGDCPFTFERIFTATDACGNSSSSVQVITIVDTVAPELSGEDTEVTIECDATPELPEVTATDACDDDVEIDLTTEVIDGDCPQEFTEVYTWIATDDCDNQSVRTFTVNYVDTTAPILIGVPEDVTAECDNVPAPAQVSAEDNCGGVELNFAEAINELDCGYELIRTWTAIDECGNQNVATQTVTVVDTTEPDVISAPQDITLECDQPEPVVAPVFADNCDDDLEIVAISGITNVNDCGFTIERAWTAIDDCGNSTTVTQVITFIDTTAPVISDVPADVTVVCTDLPAPAEVTAVDNCDDNPTVELTETIGGGCPYTITRTWVATDACGNQSSATQVITVIDEEAPILVGVPDDFVGECGNAPGADQVTAIDNCDEDIPVILTEEVLGEVCPLTIVRTWTATDNCGNTVSASQTITINDTTAPVFVSGPEDATVECDMVPGPDNDAIEVEDNCDLNLEITFEETSTPGEPAVEGGEPCGEVITRVWTATDDCGNSSSFTQVITVVDTTAPVLVNVPEDTTVECTAIPQPAVVTAVDNCFDGVMNVSLEESIVPAECGFQIVRTWTAADNCLNVGSATQVITVVDTEAPIVLTTPEDVTVECDEDLPNLMPSFDDACDEDLSITMTETEQPQNCGFLVIRTWTATDDCGNSVSTSQSIFVTDTTPPVFDAEASDAEVECSAIPAPAQLTASDNCDLDVDITFTEEVLPGECPYSIVRTWTATDDCGNSVSTMQTLTVVDTEAPILIGVPEDATVECDAIPGVDQVVATDNCDDNLEVTFDDEIVAGGECGYSIIRTWTVTDNCGNTASASQTLTVTDTTDPEVISSPEDLSIECDEEAPLVAPEFDDNCDLDLEVGFAQTIFPGECEHSFTIVRTWTASDDCGNTTSVSQNISVTDTTAPVLVGVPEDVTAECTDIPQAATVTATDNCDSNVMVVLEESLEPLECGFIVTRTWTATDDCGNTTSASQVITAIDETDPIAISVPQDITIECDEVVPDAMPMFTDNCDNDLEITAASSISILECGELIERSWTATDDCGNSVTVSQTITVVDTTAPVFTDVPQDATVECDAVPAPAQVAAEDNCDDNLIILFEENIVEEGCPYVIERTWTVFDNCNNNSSYTQTITVVDTTDPILIGVPEDATVECDAVPAAATVTADDNCADNLEVFFVEGVEMLDCGFILTRTWSATDECGNTASATQVLTVVDTTAPVLIGVPENVTAECDAVPAPAVVSAEDNCDQQLGVTLTEEEEMQDCGYLLIRTWSVSDDCGNTAAATQVITVVDTTAPIILNAPEDVTVQCDEVPGTGNIEVTDNCDPLVEVNVTEMTEDIECGFILTRTFTATDDCGNAATHIQTITVQDTEAPVILGVPADVTIECGEPVPAPGQVDVEDNCDPMPMVTTSEETVDLDCGFQIVRTYLATDECGNVGTAQQVITVTDTTPPVFEGQPEDATVNCEELGMAPTLTATDNCDDNVEVTFEEIIGDGCPYTVERIWTATDDCGNTATVTQTLTVIDEEAPVFDDYEFSISMSCEEVDDFLLTATDNCDLDVEVTVVEELTFSGGCLGVLARTYQAVDNCGNVTEVEQLIQVFDDVAPVVFNAPEDLELMCGDEIPAPANDVFATDNCDAEVEIEFTEEQTSEFCPYEIIRTWTAVDECFNTTTVTQVITVDVIVDEFNVSVVTYPNPMDERFTVEFTVPFDSDVVGGVYDMTGREVLPVFQGRADARRLYQLQYGNLNWEAGTYILMLTVDDEVYYHKIVVTQR